MAVTNFEKHEIRMDSQRLSVALDELIMIRNELSGLAGLSDFALQLLERVDDLLGKPDDIFTINGDVGAALAHKTVVFVEPSQLLLGCLVAARAVYRNLNVIGDFMHKGPPLLRVVK